MKHKKYKESGRVMALLLSVVLMLGLLPLPVRAAGAETGVQLGDYIRLGSYDGEPILWRCVSVDENGPLMLSDKVLCDSMPYDAQTSENSTSGSHHRSGYRSKYGSNHWRDSDMRSWLNSDAEAGQVKWLCGNPPKDGYIMGGGAYDGKAGFLNGFTRDEAAAIKTVTQRSIVSHPEYTAGYIDASGADLPYNTDIGSVADGYEGAHYENITDKVFLLDVKQLCTVYENLSSYYIAQNRNGVNWSYWLRTPVTDCNHDMRYVSPQGSIGRDAPCKGYYFNDRLRIYKRPLPARKMKIHIPHGVNAVMGHTRMTTQGNAQFNQNNHPFLGKIDGNCFALAHNGVLWNDKELRTEENLPLTSVETDSYVAVQLLEKNKTLDFDSLKFMAEAVEGSFVFTVLDRDDSIWFVVGDNPLCVMLYDGFLIYASTQEILCKALKKLRLKAPTDILEPQEGEILKIDRNGRITTGAFAPRTSYEHWWRRYSPYYRDFCVDTPPNYDDLFNVAKAFGVTADEVQALLDYGCSEEEIEEMLYDPTLLHEMTGELLYAY